MREASSRMPSAASGNVPSGCSCDGPTKGHDRSRRVTYSIASTCLRGIPRLADLRAHSAVQNGVSSPYEPVAHGSDWAVPWAASSAARASASASALTRSTMATEPPRSCPRSAPGSARSTQPTRSTIVDPTDCATSATRPGTGPGCTSISTSERATSTGTNSSVCSGPPATSTETMRSSSRTSSPKTRPGRSRRVTRSHGCGISSPRNDGQRRLVSGSLRRGHSAEPEAAGEERTSTAANRGPRATIGQ
jgi:hypothetical protein